MLPLIGDIAPPQHRATAISLVSSGLLLGLLIARVLAGVVSQYTDWRNIYWLALGLQAFITAALWGFMPDYPATNPISASASASTSTSALASRDSSATARANGSIREKAMIYPSILWSIVTIFMKNATLIQACIMGFFFSAPYTSFWTTLTFLLSESPYHYSTLIIGIFALVGILPMGAGPIYSRIILDKVVPLPSTLLGIGLCLVGAAIGVVMVVMVVVVRVRREKADVVTDF